METKWLLSGILLCGLVVGGAWVLSGTSDSETRNAAADDGPVRSKSKVEQPAGSAPSARTPIIAPEDGPSPDRATDALSLAIAEHEAAQSALEQAERDLDDLEREVEAVEAFVEDIVERGEDPARHAFDAMEKLNPVIDRYEALLAKAEAAEARVQETQALLDAARASLAEDRSRAQQ